MKNEMDAPGNDCNDPAELCRTSNNGWMNDCDEKTLKIFKVLIKSYLVFT